MEKQKDWLDGSEWEAKIKLSGPRRLQVMHKAYGITPGKQCGQCRFLTWHTLANRYYKCVLTRMTHGPATDWRRRWKACGQFQERT